MFNHVYKLWRVTCVLFAFILSPFSIAQASNRIAIFCQAGFPAFNQTQLVSPTRIALDLTRCGVAVDLLNSAQLADPTKFNIAHYAVAILPYGNGYPLNAFNNLRKFHLDGGSLVLSGIPFTHAVQQAADGSWQDQGNDNAPALFSGGGIGVGGYSVCVGGNVTLAAADPLQLKDVSMNWIDGSYTQVIDPTTIPSGDTITPIVVSGAQAVAAVIVHHDTQFAGAIDVWTNNGAVGEDIIRAYVSEQLMERGTIYVLRLKGFRSPVQAEHAITVISQDPSPYITLPVMRRPYETLQPKMPVPARSLLVVDVRNVSKDERLMIASLQGIVNRSQPRIYLIASDDDQFWLDQMIAQEYTGTPQIVENPLSLFQTFRKDIVGVVVPDPNCYVTPDVAVDLAGIDNLVIATPQLAQLAGLPIKADLRGRFKNDADALRFVRQNLLLKSDRYLALCLDPEILGSQVDDIIAARGTCFWITGPKEQDRPGADEDAETQEIEQTFAQMPLTAIIRGFWWRGDGMGLDETPGVTLGSEYGKITTVSDYVSNFSVTSGIPLKELKQKTPPVTPPLDGSKVYLALTMSDGDNLCTWRNYFRGYFTSPLYGTFPLAFGMGPSLIDTAPNEAQWYYQHAAANTEFLCDVSGAGYIYPSQWAIALKDRSTQLATFYQWTSQYMARLDMHTLRLMNVGTVDIAAAGSMLPQVQFLMPDYGLAGESDYSQYTYTLPSGQSVFRGASDGPGPEKLADEIRQHSGNVRPAFLNAFIWNWGSSISDLKQMLDLLGPEYVAVTPSQLDQLYRESKAAGVAAPSSSPQ